MLVAWVLFPLVLLALCAGLGLLVDAISGRRLPGALVPAVGMAAIVVVGELTTAAEATAGATAPVLVVLALLGAALSRPWRFGRPDPWPAAAALAVFAVFAAPVVLSGSPSFGGYIKLDDTASWLALTDQVMEHGHSLSWASPSTVQATLDFYGGAYPVGTFIPFGSAAELVGGERAWLFQPYIAVLAVTLALALWELLAGLVRKPRLRALCVFVAAQPALLYGYSLWGGVKEVGAAALVALVAALAPALLRDGAGWRDTVPAAVACSAIAAELSPGGLVWVAPMLLVVAALLVRRGSWREMLALAVPFGGIALLLTIPVLSHGLVSGAVSDSLKSNELGNLIEPLSPLQAFGIWPAGDFRVDPDLTALSALLIAAGAASAALGLWLAWRRRSLALLLYVTTLVSCAAIVVVVSPWNDAKAWVTVAPMLLALAMGGAAAAMAREKLAAVLLVAVTAGVLWSNALAYHEVSLAPYDQLSELQSIAGEIDGEGPTLMTEYQPYGVRHFLRGAEAEAVSELRVRPILRLDGAEVEKGRWEDTDGLSLPELLEYRTLVLRHSPAASRPPSVYRLVRPGSYYDVWQRPPGAGGGIAEHLPLGDFEDPATEPDCGEVLRLAGVAGPGGRLAAVERRPNVVAQVVDGEAGFTLPAAGSYAAYALGSAPATVSLDIDGDRVGSVAEQRNPDGQFLSFGEVRLAAGAHSAELDIGSGSLAPGSGVSYGPVGPLVLDSNPPRLPVTYVPAARARSLCGRHLDWVEALP